MDLGLVSPAMGPAAFVRLAALALLIAALPLARWWWLHRSHDVGRALAGLTLLTAFLTFDLIVFGAFTRLSDAGLGCPDWPGCYGQTSPLAAADQVHAAQLAMPTGPVTAAKAWVEMLHRYLAMAIGVLIACLTALAWRWRAQLPTSPWWPTLTLAWVVVQGLFGRWTVTLKLYPAVVTAHLLGGVLLLALLVAQFERQRARAGSALPIAPIAAVAALLIVQLLLGGWVSSNYAVLACQGLPTCNGQWWPAMNFAAGFELLRPLGRSANGDLLPLDALVAIQFTHRAFAVMVLVAAAALAWRLGRDAAASSRRSGALLAGLLLLQAASGVSNVVLGWPLVAALAHSGGAAALIALVTALLVRARQPAQPSALSAN